LDSVSSSEASRSRSVFSSGRIMALSLLSPARRGRVERVRVVARRRWLQKLQCWVWIGRVEDILI